MLTWPSLLSATHLVGLSLAVGAASAKLVLLFRCRSDVSSVPVFTRTTRLLTRQIILGMVLLTLSGIGWLVLGYPITTRLVVKLVLAAALWVIGPVIDNVVEPAFLKGIPEAGAPSSPTFLAAHRRYLMVEFGATLTFYVTIVMWVWR